MKSSSQLIIESFDEYDGLVEHILQNKQISPDHFYIIRAVSGHGYYTKRNTIKVNPEIPKDSYERLVNTIFFEDNLDLISRIKKSLSIGDDFIEADILNIYLNSVDCDLDEQLEILRLL